MTVSLSLRSGELFGCHLRTAGHGTDATTRSGFRVGIGLERTIRVPRMRSLVHGSVSGLSRMWWLHHRTGRLGLTKDEFVARSNVLRDTCRKLHHTVAPSTRESHPRIQTSHSRHLSVLRPHYVERQWCEQRRSTTFRNRIEIEYERAVLTPKETKQPSHPRTERIHSVCPRGKRPFDSVSSPNDAHRIAFGSSPLEGFDRRRGNQRKQQ